MQTTTPAGRRTLMQIFKAPIVLGVVAAWGLIAALLMEGPIDLLWSAMAALPVAVVLFNVLRR